MCINYFITYTCNPQHEKYVETAYCDDNPTEEGYTDSCIFVPAHLPAPFKCAECRKVEQEMRRQLGRLALGEAEDVVIVEEGNFVVGEDDGMEGTVEEGGEGWI